MNTETLKSGRRRRTYTAQFKADMVAQCLLGDVSLASLAVDHGMNPNVLHRWVMEHERYGKHSLQDSGDEVLAIPTRDMSPAHWIPLNPAPTPGDRTTAAPAPANDTIAMELSARGLSLTLRWPVREHQALADWTRTLLT